LNNSVKHWPIFIIFGTQHHKKLDVPANDYNPIHLTSILLLQWYLEVVGWPFTTMNSYWVAHALAQKLLI